MSRNLIGGLLLIFFAVLAIGYAGVIPLGDDSPRPVSDDNGVDNGDPMEVGQIVYEQQCFGCHSIDGSSSVGPTFQGLHGSEVTMDDGTTLVVDDDHLLEAITDPRATTRDGYPDVMPPFDNLSEAELAGLIAFIRSLE
jgi:cytochrome c oxidase subunit II